MKSTKKLAVRILCCVLALSTIVPFALAADTYPAVEYKGNSIVDALKSIKVDASKEHRAAIAEVNGIKDYKFTAEQNTEMLKLLKEGKLVVANYNKDLTPPAPTAKPGCYEIPKYKGNSIVDALKAIKVDASKEHRAAIAEVNGIKDYKFTAEQNTQMLKLLLSGDLKVANYNKDLTPPKPVAKAGCYDIPNYKGNSIVDALKAIKVDSSKANRAKIAAANGIADYKFTAEQNTQLLKLLLAGELKKA